MDNVPKEYEDCCAKVMDYLYVGDKKSAKSKSLLEKVGITEIINVTPPRNQGGVHNFFDNDTMYNYLRIPCVDSDVEDITPYFQECIEFINNARNKGHSVLVHCQMGQSRSVTIILAYMISMDEWDLKTAYTHLKTIRPKVKPKSNFLRQLIKFQSTYHTKDNHHEKDNDNDNENDDDEDDDIKQTKNDNKSNENTSNDKRSNGKKRKLEEGELQQPPSKKLKLSNGNENNDKTPQVQPRVFGVALPPHLIK